MRTLFFIIILLLLFGCDKKEVCQDLGKKYFPFNPNSNWTKMENDNECVDYQIHEINFEVNHNKCLNTGDYTLAISIGKNCLFYGDYKQKVSLKLCCLNTETLSTIIIRVVDKKFQKVYQWNKKESYNMCKVSKVKICLPFDNYQNDYSIKLN